MPIGLCDQQATWRVELGPEFRRDSYFFSQPFPALLIVHKQSSDSANECAGGGGGRGHANRVQRSAGKVSTPAKRMRRG